MTAPAQAQDVAQWWAANPQTYGDVHGVDAFEGEQKALGSKEFFENADKTMIAWNHNLHTNGDPFSAIYPYERFRGKRVLEVGCGMGGMAAMWARHGAQLSAVDLNPVAVAQTRRRFELFGLTGDIRQVDARSLDFPEATFDYVYSWGVLHHSPDLATSVAQLLRTLKPGGEFGVMLYHRHSLLYWYRILMLEGWVHGEKMFLDELALSSRYTDGERAEGNPHTWPITRDEAKAIFGPHVKTVDVRVLGTDVDGILAAEVAPGLMRVLPRSIRKAVARRYGWSLWISGTK